MKLASQAAKYGVAGVLNTVVGLAVIYLCMVLGVGDVLANAIGYGVGLACSFLLNARWTFAYRSPRGATAARFLLVVALAYLANLLTLLAARDTWGVDSRIAQLLGVMVYAGIGFFGSRVYAFGR